jgi:hypothetical protein
MSDYLLMVLEDESAHASESPHAMAELIERRTRFADGLRRAGRLKDSGRLRPSSEGKRAHRDGAALRVEDGPFAEAGKAFGAYYWIQAENVEDAAKLAAACPTLPADEIDVRPLMKGMVEGDKAARPGKVFAFAVLGNTATEAAWVKVMDRIDAETDPFPRDAFLGGVRLEPPRSGRRVATQGERRAMFDGPFLESKEVIGGVFFLRMANVEDAVRWASGTHFVVHGALEIRELWRT